VDDPSSDAPAGLCLKGNVRAQSEAMPASIVACNYAAISVPYLKFDNAELPQIGRKLGENLARPEACVRRHAFGDGPQDRTCNRAISMHCIAPRSNRRNAPDRSVVGATRTDTDARPDKFPIHHFKEPTG
jgi:hypothetical protein